VVVSLETYAVDAERRLRGLVRTSKSEAFLVELNAQVAGILIGPAASRLDELEKETGRRFAFKTRPRVAPSHFALLAEGPAAEIDPQAFPVTAGQELELDLEETHLHDDGDAIGRLDGYVITVTGAGGSVGEKVKVRIEHAGRTSAHAVLAGEPSVDGGPKVADEAVDAVEPKPKRKTRRGSRGGRGRRKKTAAAPSVAEAPADAEPEPEVEAVTPEEVGEEKPKRKTRRGTRGGRKRRKPTAKPATEAGEGFAAREEAG
jgi:predicted RNA-binding protein with TRAM domain